MISDHVRYIFHDNQDMVPLQTELHHVENYIQMQRYITSQSIAFHMEVEPGLEEAQVPALCLQTFVENSCKYATVPGRGLEISLEVRQLPSEEGGRLDAVIQDNGPGLSQELLREFNGQVSFQYREDHIGVSNIRQRLQLLYGGDCGFACRNLAPGTEFELIFPLQRKGLTTSKEAEKHEGFSGG